MEIAPDTKDWTWVLERSCDECGFDPATIGTADLPQRVRTALGGWPDRLADAGSRSRPEPGVWSPLEYGAHVRDVCRVMTQRLALMLAEDDPMFSDWDQDATAVEQDYASQDPAAVAAGLRESGAALAATVAGIGPEQWGRRGVRSNGSVFTVATLGVYALHDLEHHVHDVAR